MSIISFKDKEHTKQRVKPTESCAHCTFFLFLAIFF